MKAIYDLHFHTSETSACGGAAAILTLPDVVSRLMPGIPMPALYAVGVHVSRMVKRTGRTQA